MLTEKALTVNLTISQWTARKYDLHVSREVEAANEAQNAGRYNKHLISKERMMDIQKMARKIRDFHYENTLPWGDNGDRLLPSENYFTYMEKLSALKREYEGVVEKFTQEYEELVEQSRTRLGRMFNPSDYPRKSELLHRFGVRTVVLPVAEADFRVDLDEEELETLKVNAQQELNSRLREAVGDVWKRLKDQLQHMKERLSEKDAVFRNSLFENLESLADILPRLNITQDPNVEAVCREIRGLMVDPETVRKSTSLREKKAQEVSQLLEKYKNYFE